MNILVVGGPRWSRDVNQPSVQAVRELSKRHRVVYVYQELQGSIVRNLVQPRPPFSRWDSAKSVTRRSQVHQVTALLSVTPISGLPALLPMSFPNWLRRRQLRILVQALQGVLDELDFEVDVLWMYWWFFPELLDEIPSLVSVYDRIDEHSDYPTNRWLPLLGRAAREQDKRLIRSVDLCFVVSPSALAEEAALSNNLYLAPNGIDTSSATKALADPSRPSGLAGLKKPLIGYAGAVSDRINFALLHELACLHTDCSFVLVGGRRPKSFDELPNVHFLGPRPYADILRAIREFDIAIAPFRNDEFAKGTSPLKLLDYMFVGKPIISTPIPSAIQLADTAEGAVALAESFEEWSTHIARLCAREVSEAEVCAWRGIAMNHSTESRIRKMMEIVESAARLRAQRGSPD